MNLAIIPARSGSRRIPAKNVRLFHGKPIIAYSIETARATGSFDEIIVSTDSQDYAAVAKAYGAKVHMRARSLSDDATGTQEVTRAVLQWWHAIRDGELPYYACCIYATAPMLRPADLENAMVVVPGSAYVYVPGYFYLGPAREFLEGTPLELGTQMVFPQERYIDINTEEDWQRAELMYAALQQQEAIRA